MTNGNDQTADMPAETGAPGEPQPVQEPALGRALTAIRHSLTPGQRWTSGLLLGLAMLVVGFGLPPETELVADGGGPVRPDQAAGTVAQEPDTETTNPTRRTASAQPSFQSPAPPTTTPTPTTVPETDDDSDGSGGDGGFGGPDPFPEPTPPPDFVALVRSGDSSVPGRDDAAVAQVFLEEASFDAEVVELGEEGADTEGLCEEVAGAGDAVLAGVTLPEDLRDCLIDAGLTIVAHDAAGDIVPASEDDGELISTRRRDRESLVDLSRWALAEDVFGDRTGVVGSRAFEDEVRAAISRMRQNGASIRASVFVADDDAQASQDVANGISEFSEKNIDTVLFAARPSHQRQWLAAETFVRQASVSYLVSDLGGAIVDESYPASFDGARAHTSLRTPWFERDEGETAVQQGCRETWEEAAPPGGTTDNAELARVYTWCQLTTLVVEPALVRLSTGISFPEAVRAEEVVSPLTSDLGPLADEGFGPTEDAVLVWDATCGCWTSTREFSDAARPEDDSDTG